MDREDQHNSVRLVTVQAGKQKHILSGPEDFVPDVVVAFRDRAIPNDKKKLNKSAAQKEADRDRIIQQLLKSGLYVRVTGSDYDPDDQYVLLGASEERLERQAELIEYEMPLKPIAQESVQTDDGQLLQVGGYRKYTRSDRKAFKLNSFDHSALFSSSQRQLLIESIIHTDPKRGGAGIKIDEEVEADTITRFFCLHEPTQQDDLMRTWIKKWSSPLPNLQVLNNIRDYFGEYIAIYFAFLTFTTRWLFYATIFGIAAVVAGIVLNSYAGSYGAFTGLAPTIFSVFLGLWVTGMLNYWKRFNATLNWFWNMVDWRVSEVTRPSYRGVTRPGLFFENTWVEWPNELTTQYKVEVIESKYAPPGRTKAMISGGMVPSVALAFLTVLATIVILALRLYLQQRIDATFGSIIGGAVNAVSIKILNTVYRWLAKFLCDKENHRTQELYDNNFAVKVFMFDFVNSYTSLFYIAFFKRGSRLFFNVQDQCTGPSISFIAAGQQGPGYGCIDDLTLQIFSMLATNIAIGQVQELILPAVKLWWFNKMELRKGRNTPKAMLPPWERENLLEPYNGLGEDLEEMAIQFGYVTMFAAAFPLAPLMALINNLLEVRSDGYKFLKGTNRPRYRGARGIGVWYEIFNVLGYIAVVTNAALIVFSHPALLTLCNNDILLAFAIGVGIEHVLFVLKYATDVLIPDVPSNIKQQMARVNFIKEVLLENVTTGNDSIPSARRGSTNPLYSGGNDEVAVVDLRTNRSGGGGGGTGGQQQQQQPAAKPKTPPARTPSPGANQARQAALLDDGSQPASGTLPHSVPSAADHAAPAAAPTSTLGQSTAGLLRAESELS